jgi:hypothetical protein
MSDDGRLTRRGALALMGAGGAVVATSGTLGFTSLRSERTTNIGLAEDANAALGLLPGAWSLAVSNNTIQQVDVQVTVVAARGNSVTASDVVVVDGTDTVTLDPRIPPLGEPGTHAFLFESATGTSPTDIDEFDVLVTIPTGNGFLLRRELTVDATNDEPTSTATQAKLFVEQNDKPETLHTWSVTSFTNSIDVNQIVVDYSGLNQTATTNFFDATREQDIAVTAIDDSTGSLNSVRVDRSAIATPGGDSFTIPLRDADSFLTDDVSPLGVALGRVGPVDSAEDGQATLTVEDTTLAGASETFTIDFTTSQVSID